MSFCSPDKCLEFEWCDDGDWHRGRTGVSDCTVLSVPRWNYKSIANRAQIVNRKSGGIQPVQTIIVLGAGVQGTVFGVRLAQKGYQVTLVAKPSRAQELRQFGATIQNAKTSETSTLFLPVLESIPANPPAYDSHAVQRRIGAEPALERDDISLQNGSDRFLCRA
jgi:hypothetical protein